MRAFSGKVAMDTYAGRATAQQSNPRSRATAGEGLTAAHLPAVTRGLGIKIKWLSSGADGGVLRAWWLAIDIAGRPAGQFLAHGAVSIPTSGIWAMWAGVVR